MMASCRGRNYLFDLLQAQLQARAYDQLTKLQTEFRDGRAA